MSEGGESRRRNVGSTGAGGQSLAARSVRSVGLHPRSSSEAAGAGPGEAEQQQQQQDGFLGRLEHRWAEMDVRMRFTLIDSFLSFFIFTPLVLVYWYGVYGLLDRIVALAGVPDALAPWALLAGGIYFESLVCFLQRDLRLRLTPGSPEFVSHYLVTRLFNLVLSVANIAHYRALELLFQENVNVNLRVAFQSAATVTVLLWSLKCGRNILGPPLVVEVDSEVSDVFETSTRFKTSPEKSLAHLMDTLTSVSLVTSLVHLHWISITAVLDYIIYPHNLGMCIITSGCAGYAIVFLFILMQGPARRASCGLEKRTHFMKVLFEDLFFCGANVGVILVWKGWGQFFDALGRHFPIYHNEVDVTWLYATLVPFVLLVLVHSSGSLVTKGCDVDGDLAGDDSINFSISYFSGFFAEEIAEQVRRQEAAKAGRPYRQDENLNYSADRKMR